MITLGLAAMSFLLLMGIVLFAIGISELGMFAMSKSNDMPSGAATARFYGGIGLGALFLFAGMVLALFLGHVIHSG